MRYHDYHLREYSVSDYGCQITLLLAWDYPGTKRPDSLIQFSEVAAYHFSHTAGAIISDIIEMPLDSLVREEEAFFNESARQASLRFWRDGLEQYLGFLKNETFKAYRIESSIGFSGFVIAKRVGGKDE